MSFYFHVQIIVFTVLIPQMGKQFQLFIHTTEFAKHCTSDLSKTKIPDLSQMFDWSRQKVFSDLWIWPKASFLQSSVFNCCGCLLSYIPLRNTSRWSTFLWLSDHVMLQQEAALEQALGLAALHAHGYATSHVFLHCFCQERQQERARK